MAAWLYEFNLHVLLVCYTRSQRSLARYLRLCFSVPSIAPPNVTLTNLKHDEVMVQWDSIPPNTVNGILLGYRVYYREYYYYWSSSAIKTVDTSGSNVHMVILKGLKAAERYSISVAAFTSRGAGPQSYWRYITTGKFLF